MLYREGQLVQWKNYFGKIKFAIETNKSYIVTLYYYKGFSEVDKQIDQIELCPAYEQLTI